MGRIAASKIGIGAGARTVSTETCVAPPALSDSPMIRLGSVRRLSKMAAASASWGTWRVGARQFLFAPAHCWGCPMWGVSDNAPGGVAGIEVSGERAPICENGRRMKRKSTILGRVRDVEGVPWDVREIRDTKHGFDLLFGSPAPRLGSYRGGLPRLIATRPLMDFWEANRTKHDGVLYDLPAGRTTLKRLRHRFGFHYLDDLSEFWKERIEDLKALSTREFAMRHNVDFEVVSDAHARLLGRRARELDWWRKPRPLKILRSNITLREMAGKLGISISQAKRLRDRARRQQ